MKDLTKYFIDLSKCSEEQIENIYNTVKETGFIKPNFYTDKDFMMLKFCTIEERWGCSGKNWDGLKHKTELTYPEFIKLFEGGDEEKKSRIEIMTDEELQEELQVSQSHIEALEHTVRSIENEIFYRANPNPLNSNQ